MLRRGTTFCFKQDNKNYSLADLGHKCLSSIIAQREGLFFQWWQAMSLLLWEKGRFSVEKGKSQISGLRKCRKKMWDRRQFFQSPSTSPRNFICGSFSCCYLYKNLISNWVFEGARKKNLHWIIQLHMSWHIKNSEWQEETSQTRKTRRLNPESFFPSGKSLADCASAIRNV